MEQFINIMASGLALALQPQAMVFIFIGTVWGFIVGALPGISGAAGVAILLPFLYGLSPVNAVMILAGAFIADNFSNSFPAILIRTPGRPTGVLQMIEGNPFHMRGESGRALGLSLIASLIAQVASIILMVAFLIPLSEIAIYFLFPEIFALAVFGLSAVAGLTGKNVVKGLLAAAFGVAIATVGSDPLTAQTRFGLGIRELNFGLGLVPVLLGMLAISEVFRSSRQMIAWEQLVGKFSAAMPSLADLKLAIRGTSIAIVVGFIIGIMPGAGGSAATFIAWQQAKLFAKEPEKFGKGSVEALAAAAAADNASTGGDLVPTLGLGIPGSTSAAVIMVALILVGIEPGPLLLKSKPEIVQAFFGALMFSGIMAFLLGYLLIRPAIFLVTLPRQAVSAAVIALATIGVYSTHLQLFDVLVAWIFGVVGYFMYRYGYSPAAAVLGLVLGKIMEISLRRGLVISFNSWGIFLGRPFTLLFLSFAVLTLVWSVITPVLLKRREAARAAEVAGQEPPIRSGEPVEASEIKDPND